MKPVITSLLLTAMVAMLSGCCAVGDCWRDSCARPANWCWGDQCSVAAPATAANAPTCGPAEVAAR